MSEIIKTSSKIKMATRGNNTVGLYCDARTYGDWNEVSSAENVCRIDLFDRISIYRSPDALSRILSLSIIVDGNFVSRCQKGS